MEMLGVPIEERKKAYAGVDLATLITKYNQAEKKGDLPTMLALLDIIKAAPKGKTPPMTTVKDDIMAQAMPQPQMQPQATVPGFEGVVTSMENQAGLNPPALMAAGGGAVQDVMRDGNAYDDQPGRDEYAKGGITKLQVGGMPFFNYATASDEMLQRQSLKFGDPKAAEELVRRGAQPSYVNLVEGRTPASRVAPGSTPLSPSPAATPTAGTPPTSLMRRGAQGIARLIGRHPVIASGIAIPLIGDALVGTERRMGTEDFDPITLMQGTMSQEDMPSYMAAAPVAKPPSADKTTTDRGGGGGGGGGGSNTGIPGISGLDLSAYKPRTAEEEAKRSENYIASQVAAGKIKSEDDIKKALEEFRTEGKTRAAADRAAAKEAFKENILLNAALAAPQFLRGRGLDQATARFSETFAPMALETAAQKAKSLKEADKFERDAEDKFRLAQIDMDKSARAAAEGRFAKGQELEQKATQNYLAANVQMYGAQLQANAHLMGIDKATIQEAIRGVNKRISELEALDMNYKKLPLDQKIALQQTMMNDAIKSAMTAVRGEESWKRFERKS